jgi:hypothetical protein
VEPERIITRPYAGVQTVKIGRKLFGKAAEALFLAHLAATCNVAASARAAGVTAQCVYQKRMRDADFRRRWREALEQGYARLEARALEQALGSQAVAAGTQGEVAIEVEEGPLDKELTIFLLREHKKALAGIERPGAAPQPADWSQVEDWCVRRLRTLKARLDREDEAA